jgi:hypothetical protein
MPQEKRGLHFHLRPDRQTMEVRITDGQRNTVADVVLTTQALDQVIVALGQIRSKMKPEVPQKFPRGQPTHQHGTTRYFFGIDPFTRHPALSFRSSAFGWMTFDLSSDEIERVYNSLQESKNLPIIGSSDRKH